MPDPIPTGRFNHATLNCTDVGRSVAFYRDVLGFRQVKRPGFSFAGAWLYRDGLGMMLHLNEDKSLPAPEPEINSRNWHLAFQVVDFQATIALLAEHGLRVVERVLPDHGFRQAYFHDPDGNVLELAELPDVEEMVSCQ